MTQEARIQAAGKFRKKPVVVDAFHYEGIFPLAFLADGDTVCSIGDGTGACRIETLEGPMRANVGDWIIRGTQGELYPCKPDIFAEVYEPAAADAVTTLPDEPKPIELVEQLHRAIYGDSWARPASPKELWDELLTHVAAMARGACGECIKRDRVTTLPDEELDAIVGGELRLIGMEHTRMGPSCEKCEHRFRYDDCVRCGETWPCSATRLVAEVRRLRAGSVSEYQQIGWWDGDDFHERKTTDHQKAAYYAETGRLPDDEDDASWVPVWVRKEDAT